jgi:ferric-dicitrate binding protein FerR (iron transport regulator)
MNIAADGANYDEIEQALLDRLVDGELADDEQRDVLARLESEPDGWRRLALAFIEQQRWRREFRALAAEQSAITEERRPSSRTAAEPVRPVRRGTLRARTGTAAVALAGVLAAFLLGLSLGGLRQVESDGPAPIAETGVGAEPENGVVREESASDGEQFADADADAVPFQVLRFVFEEPGSDGPQYVDVPLVAFSEASAAWLGSSPSKLPEPVKRTLQRRSFEVVERRRLYPLELEDGRRVVLVDDDEIEVRYVGSQVF